MGTALVEGQLEFDVRTLKESVHACHLKQIVSLPYVQFGRGGRKGGRGGALSSPPIQTRSRDPEGSAATKAK